MCCIRKFHINLPFLLPNQRGPLQFIGHPDAGDRTAVLYSLIVSCQRRGHNPHDYLKDVLTRLPAMTTKDDLRPLLPSQWKNPTAPAVINVAPATPAPTV